jgi:hypothetical protein
LLENNLKGTGPSSSFSYGNAVIEEKGRGGGETFSFFERVFPQPSTDQNII